MYGNEQANYTDLRASFGPYGGMMATGIGGGGGGGGMGYGDMGPQGDVSGWGGQVRPVTYMPPPMVAIPQGGMYQARMGMGTALGYTIGWNEPPRNVSAYDIRGAAGTAFGEQLGAGLTGAGVTAAGYAAGMGLMGAGSAVGGFVGAGAGMLLGGPLGALAGAKVGGFIGGMAAPMMIDAVSGGITDLMSQQRETRNYLEAASFRFTGAGSPMADPRTGAGMNIAARRAIAEQLTEMDVKDKFMNTEDLSRVLKSGVEQGMFTGTSDLEDFKKKFTTLKDNVKEIAKTFNTTIEESVKVMRDMRGMGMDPTQVRTALTAAESFGKIAGRTGAEMFAIGQQGAEIFRGTGVSMQIGFQATQANLAQIRAQRDAGVLSQEAIAQAGGEEALAMRMTTSGLSQMQTARGRGGLMALSPGGRFDRNAFGENLAAGGMDLLTMGARAAVNMGDPTALLRYQANQAKTISEAGKMFGGQGLQLQELAQNVSEAMFLNKATGSKLSDEEAFRAYMVRKGATEPEIDTQWNMMKDRKKFLESQHSALGATYNKQMADQAWANLPFTRLAETIRDTWTGIKNDIAAPLNRMTDNLMMSTRTGFEKAFLGMETFDTGRYQIQAKAAADIGALPGASLANRGRLQRVSLDEATWDLGASSGRNLAAAGIEELSGLGIEFERDEGKMDVELRRARIGRPALGLTAENYEKVKRLNLTTYAMTEDKLAAQRGTEPYKAAVADIVKGTTTLFQKSPTDAAGILSAYGFDADTKQPTALQWAAMRETLKGTKYGDVLDRFAQGAQAGQMLIGEVEKKNVGAYLEDYKKIVEKLPAAALGVGKDGSRFSVEDFKKAMPGFEMPKYFGRVDETRFQNEMNVGLLKAAGSMTEEEKLWLTPSADRSPTGLAGEKENRFKAAKSIADRTGLPIEAVSYQLDKFGEGKATPFKMELIEGRRGVEGALARVAVTDVQGQLSALAFKAEKPEQKQLIEDFRKSISVDASKVMTTSPETIDALRAAGGSAFAAKIADLKTLGADGTTETQRIAKVKQLEETYGVKVSQTSAEAFYKDASKENQAKVANEIWNKSLVREANPVQITGAVGGVQTNTGAGTAQDQYVTQVAILADITRVLGALASKMHL